MHVCFDTEWLEGSSGCICCPWLERLSRLVSEAVLFAFSGLQWNVIISNSIRPINYWWLERNCNQAKYKRNFSFYCHLYQTIKRERVYSMISLHLTPWYLFKLACTSHSVPITRGLTVSFYSITIFLTTCFIDRHERIRLVWFQDEAMQLAPNRYGLFDMLFSMFRGAKRSVNLCICVTAWAWLLVTIWVFKDQNVASCRFSTSNRPLENAKKKVVCIFVHEVLFIGSCLITW